MAAELPDIELTLTGLIVDGDSLAFDEITSVGYIKKVMRASGVITDVIRRFEVCGQGGRRIPVKLDGARVLRDEKEEEWRRLVAASQEAIEPRLRALAMERIQRGGDAVEIGRLELRSDGFAWNGPLRPKRYPWSDYFRAFYANCQIRVLAQPTDRGKDRRVGNVDTSTANAVLLPKLMDACSQAFGGTATASE